MSLEYAYYTGPEWRSIGYQIPQGTVALADLVDGGVSVPAYHRSQVVNPLKSRLVMRPRRPPAPPYEGGPSI